MREIKFRAWDKEEKNMINWKGLYSLSELVDIFDDEDLLLMQYTGLKDKKGVEIYEGDIIKGIYSGTLDYSKIPMIVIFENGAFRESYFKNSLGSYTNMSYGKGNVLKIIGNIYENPELLEEKK